MTTRWKPTEQACCRLSETAAVGAALSVGLRFERFLGRAFWVLLIGVIFWLGRS